MFCNIDIYKDRVNKNSKGSTIIDFTENPPKVIKREMGIFIMKTFKRLLRYAKSYRLIISISVFFQLFLLY